MNLSLPSAQSSETSSPNATWVVAVSAQGAYAINGSLLEGRQIKDLQNGLLGLEKTDGSLLIKADASASHQAVVNVLEAARLNGISKIAFATQQGNQPPSKKP